jgi:hypothetical protein
MNGKNYIDFAAQVTDGYDQLVIFPDFDLAGRTQDNICYFDNITFHPHDGKQWGNFPTSHFPGEYAIH